MFGSRAIVTVSLSLLCSMSAVSAADLRALNTGTPPTNAEPQDDQTISAIDELTNTAVPKQAAASLTIGIVRDGSLNWSKSYGYADMERQIPANTHTVYRIASVTKLFTALMLLQLVQDGKVNLSDPVEKYFPEINTVKNRYSSAPPITLMQLATHTSGLAREPQNPRKYTIGPVADWERILIEALKDTKYDFEPGTGFHYSNIGYAVLGTALGRAAHQPYTEYVRQHIFEPLGMTHTAFEADHRMIALLAKGYVVQKSGEVDWSQAEQEREQGRGYKVPNGAVYTTVGDLAKFIVFELGGGPATVLRSEALQQNFQRIITTNEDFSSGSGVGYEVLRQCNLVYFGHQGSMAGYEADAFFNRPTKSGVILLHNAVGDPFDDEEFTLKIFEKLTGACEHRSP